MNGSVRPSVRPSITPFSLRFHHCIIMKFSVINIDKSNVYAKKEKRSRSEVKGQGNRGTCFSLFGVFWDHNSSSFYRWLRNDAHSLKWYRRGAQLFFKFSSNFKVTRDKNLPILTQIVRFWTVTQVRFHWWRWNDAQSLE